jgi:hypothetical protein
MLQSLTGVQVKKQKQKTFFFVFESGSTLRYFLAQSNCLLARPEAPAPVPAPAPILAIFITLTPGANVIKQML